MKTGPAETDTLNALSSLSQELAQTFVSIASDIALVMDADGTIRNVALSNTPLTSQADHWVGKPWADTVTPDTRGKIERLLQEVSSSGVSRRSEVNHTSASGAGIPVSYAAIRLGNTGPVLAVGRDLRAIAAIQQRFVESQQELERDYWKLRQAESRYKLLFQVANDAVLVLDSHTLHTLEANDAAQQLLGHPASTLTSQALTHWLDASSRAAVEQLMDTTRATGRPAEVRAKVASTQALIELTATPVRGDGTLLLLVRARLANSPQNAPDHHRQLANLVERTRDAVVITDTSGRILMANPAFMGMCQLQSEAQALGHSLSEWLGQAELAWLLSTVQKDGMATRTSATAHNDQGHRLALEVSATLLPDGDQECIGFTLRSAVSHTPDSPDAFADLARAIERLGTQVGQVQLTDLLIEASKIAERHIIKTAVAKTTGDIAAAATLLGIERDSLVLRLYRAGLSHRGTGVDDVPPALLN